MSSNYQLPKFATSDDLLFGGELNILEKLAQDHDSLTELFDEVD